MSAAVTPLRIPRIMPDAPGGWYVVLGSFGWLYSSRNEALRAARELAQVAQ
jgi:hypothetical protein